MFQTALADVTFLDHNAVVEAQVSELPLLHNHLAHAEQQPHIAVPFLLLFLLMVKLHHEITFMELLVIHSRSIRFSKVI